MGLLLRRYKHKKSAVDLNKLTVDELIELANKKDIKISKKQKKEDIIALLKGV